MCRGGVVICQRDMDKLKEPTVIKLLNARFFIDAGALCWPNGLEISPAKMYELAAVHHAA